MNRGDIYLVDLYDSKGHEQRGKRPALILGHANGMVVVVPLTSNVSTARFSHTYTMEPTKENGLDCISILLLFQIVSLDNKRFVHKIGKANPNELKSIDTLIKDLLSL
jgi:mRNA interferase MazF